MEMKITIASVETRSAAQLGAWENVLVRISCLTYVNCKIFNSSIKYTCVNRVFFDNLIIARYAIISTKIVLAIVTEFS